MLIQYFIKHYNLRYKYRDIFQTECIDFLFWNSFVSILDNESSIVVLLEQRRNRSISCASLFAVGIEQCVRATWNLKNSYDPFHST